MRTIVEPKEHIDKLWGKQRIRSGDTYRIMRYVLRVDHDGKALLHNVVTGQLVILDEAERALLAKLPTEYGATMNQLIAGHYLVTDDYDEHQKVVQMRDILRKLADMQNSQGIVHYTILPTTACNARCYYCYQRDVRPETMSMQIADGVVSFIREHCKGNRAWIRWFGGEPTLAVHLIDHICEGLRNNSVDFSSRMTTNGYLLDEELIEKMKNAWNLEQIMISLDGSEANYNRIKAFAEVQDNPYRRVLRNVGILLDQGIPISLRMNFGRGNYSDFGELLSDVEHLFGKNPLLEVRPHYIIPDNRAINTESLREYEQWCDEEIVNLNEMSRNKGFFHKKYPLPSMKYEPCLAASDNAVVIMPDGSLVSCPDLLGKDQVKGDIWHGITDKAKVLSWKQFGDYERCRNCLFYPKCLVALNCAGGGSCTVLNEYTKQYTNTVRAFADQFK